MNWSVLPDLAAVGLLTGAFASVARRNQTHISKIWLTGWLMIAIHFASFLFILMDGPAGILAMIVGLSALTWAGLLFMWASVPYRKEGSSRWMLILLLIANSSRSVLLCRRSSSSTVRSAGQLSGFTAPCQSSFCLSSIIQRSAPKQLSMEFYSRFTSAAASISGLPIAVPRPARSLRSRGFWHGLRFSSSAH